MLSRIGRRGAFLLFLALVDLSYAYGLAFPTEQARAGETLRFLAHIMPLRAWAALWAAVGVLCVVQAPMRFDRVAFTAAVLNKILFGVLSALAFAVGALPRGYISAAIWLGFAGITLLIAGWPEHVRPRRRVADG